VFCGLYGEVRWLFRPIIRLLFFSFSSLSYLLLEVWVNYLWTNMGVLWVSVWCVIMYYMLRMDRNRPHENPSWRNDPLLQDGPMDRQTGRQAIRSWVSLLAVFRMCLHCCLQAILQITTKLFTYISSIITPCRQYYQYWDGNIKNYHYYHHHHHHKHQELDPLIYSISKVTTALSNVSSAFQLFSFFVVCSGMISKGLPPTLLSEGLVIHAEDTLHNPDYS